MKKGMLNRFLASTVALGAFMAPMGCGPSTPSATDLHNTPETTEHIPALPGEEVQLEPEDLIIQLWQDNVGVALGEIHGRYSVVDLLIENMAKFKAAGLEHIYTESVLSSMQDSIDEYMALDDEQARQFREEHSEAIMYTEVEYLDKMMSNFIDLHPYLADDFSNNFLPQLQEDLRALDNPPSEEEIANLVAYLNDKIESITTPQIEIPIHPLVELLSEINNSFGSASKKLELFEAARQNGVRIIGIESDIISEITNDNFFMNERNAHWQTIIDANVEDLSHDGKRLVLCGGLHLSGPHVGTAGIDENYVGIDRQINDPAIFLIENDEIGVWRNQSSNIDFVVSLPTASDQEKTVNSLINEILVENARFNPIQTFDAFLVKSFPEEEGFDPVLWMEQENIKSVFYAILLRTIYAEQPTIKEPRIGQIFNLSGYREGPRNIALANRFNDFIRVPHLDFVSFANITVTNKQIANELEMPLIKVPQLTNPPTEEEDIPGIDISDILSIPVTEFSWPELELER